MTWCWTGWTSGMLALVSGGLDGANALRVDGRLYQPSNNTWVNTMPNFPSGRDHEYGVGVWSGAELILWSGLDNGVLDATGERYRP